MRSSRVDEHFTTGVNYLGLNPQMQTKNFSMPNTYQTYKTDEYVWMDDYTLPNNQNNSKPNVQPRRIVESYGIPHGISLESRRHGMRLLNKHAEDQQIFQGSFPYDTYQLVNQN